MQENSSEGSQSTRQYRSRKQKPCDLCRERKARCVRGVGGDCVLCSNRGRPCTFISKPLIRHYPSRAVGAVSLPDSNADSAGGVEPGSLPHDSAANVSKMRDHSQDVGLEAAQYVGLSADCDPFILANSPCQQAKSRGSIEWRSQRKGQDYIMPISFTRLRDSCPTASLDDPMRQVDEMVGRKRETLLAAFFDNIHTAFPLLDREHCLAHNLSPYLSVSMYLLARLYCPDARDIDPRVLVDSYTRMRPIITQRPRLEAVEAAILFSQWHDLAVDGCNVSGAWSEVGALVGLGQELGLNVDSTSWNLSSQEKGRRRRLWWAIYIIDKWSAMTLGRPSYIHDEQYNVPMLSTTDFPTQDHSPLVNVDAQDPVQPMAISCFRAMATLSIILSDLLKALYTLRSVEFLRDKSAEFILDLAEPIINSLSDWRTRYLGPLLMRTAFPDVTGTVELAYYTVEIMLCRAIYPKLYRRRFDTSSFLERAVNFTSKVADLVQNLSLSRASVFWWSFSALNLTICGTFMVSMMRLSPDRDFVDLWKHRVSHYRMVLRAQGECFNSAKFARARLDAFLCGIEFDKSWADDRHSDIDQLETTDKINVDSIKEMLSLDTPSANSMPSYAAHSDLMPYDMNIDMD